MRIPKHARKELEAHLGCGLLCWRGFARFRCPDCGESRIDFAPDVLVVHLLDGRSLSVPLEWFPRLRDASPEQRTHYEFSGHGYAIHWPDIDEDISVPGLFGLPD